MKHKTLYRKYRPKQFNQIVGQESIVKILKNSLKTDNLVSSYIFAGTKGTGKTSIAKIFANALNCTNLQDGDICSACEVCKEFIDQKTMDIIEIDAASNNGVDDVRKIIDSCSFFPALYAKKVYIIDEAHMLTNQAWNALLKTIEEPPSYVTFIFATTEVHKIPDTIISRCQCFYFVPIPKAKLISHLSNICTEEKIVCDQQALEIIYDIAKGSMRDALSILQQAALFTSNNIKEQTIYEIYGYASFEDVYKFFHSISLSDTKDVLKKLDSYNEKVINIPNFCSNVNHLLTETIIYNETKDGSLLNKFKPEQIKSLNIDKDKITKLVEIWQNTYFKVCSFVDRELIFKAAALSSIQIFESNKQNKDEKSNANIEKQENNMPKQTIIAKEPTTTAKIDTNLSNIFTTKDITPVKKEIVETPNKPKRDIRYKLSDIIDSCFVNKTKEDYKIADEFINDIKNGIITEQILLHLGTCSKVAFASKNVIVVLFKHSIDAKLLNDQTYDHNFLLDLCKYFDKPIFIVGITYNEVTSQKKHFESLMNGETKNDQCDIGVLRDILDDGDSIQQKAYNILFKNKTNEK